ncbi:MAG: YbaN family protein, partial [Chromatiales bacterium]|nr:YbaN family protein [Chromatiales bacterium]
MKPLYLLLGWCSFGLGAVGAFVPGLPTVPLMLVALWAFSRSSQRFHDWLYSHRVFGPPLQQWKEYGVIPLRAKVAAIATMAASLLYMFAFAEMALWIRAVTLLLMAVGAGFIL